jgi:hypothetical protein
MVDGGSILAKRGGLKHLVFFDLNENLIECKDALGVWNFNCINIDEFDNPLICSQSHDELSPSENSIVVLVQTLIYLLHNSYLRFKKLALRLLSLEPKCLLQGQILILLSRLPSYLFLLPPWVTY